MEITTIGTFIPYYDKIRERTKRLLAVVPPDSLDWAYMPGKFTIGDEIRHIATIERYMFAETVAGRPSSYSGCGKDLADGYDAVMAYFDQLHEESMNIFRALSEEDLQRKCTTPGNATMPVWKWLRAMVEHEIHHRAQLYIYLNMIGVKTPPMFGLSAEEVAAQSVK
ncbi:DinB family protein [Chitinophaga qingshengii]|uniref:DinB family protein n=1 Tax=Chitinophaga qingshengii TaxID=1569794 RepID=A0ABR7TFR1_9BACT|nr:DinB family protein [Chitinophaga qingshengii]MBC9929192.1 DinB family protein [Chitinophaga qingshengii]